MVIGITGMMAVTVTMATYRENGILRRLQTTPVSPLVVMSAQVIVVFLMTALGTLLLISAGKIFYDIEIPGNAFSIAAGFVLSSLSFFGVGFILASILPTARTAQVTAMVLMYPMLIFSGAAWPRDLMPAAVQNISAFFPLTYVVNLLRGLWMGESWGAHLLDVCILVVMLGLGVLISARTFRWE
jgi:ABC-2 type transport system permease protein